jgi:hypothetical protein
VSRADITIQRILSGGTFANVQNTVTTWTADAVAGVKDLALDNGEVYRLCIRLANVAGIPSLSKCTNGVTIGIAKVPVSSTENYEVLLSPIPNFMFTDANDSANGNETLPPLADDRPLVTLNIPPHSVTGNETLQAAEVSTVPAGTVQADTRANMQFGGYGLSLDFVGHKQGYVFQEPVELSIYYTSTGNEVLDAQRAPALQLYTGGTW